MQNPMYRRNSKVFAALIFPVVLTVLTLSLQTPSRAAGQAAASREASGSQALDRYPSAQDMLGVDTAPADVAVKNGRIAITDRYPSRIWTVSGGSCLFGPLEGSDATWSPDGTQIAASGEVLDFYDIVTMNADGANRVNLTNAKSPEAYDVLPGWSPDGERIVFVSTRDGNRELYVMKADGSEQTRLTNSPADENFPAWSPDGKSILFESSAAGNRDIYSFDIISNGPPVNLTNTPNEHEREAEWSPDGQVIVFASRAAETGANSDIYVMDANGGNRTNLTNSPSVSEDNAIWSPDGTLIAYRVSGPSAGFYTMKPDGSDKQYFMSIDFNKYLSEVHLDDWQPLLEQETTIDVVKTVLGTHSPAGGWAFDMTDVGSFTLIKGECKVFSNVSPGAYHLAEKVLPDYDQSVTCSNGASGANAIDFEIADGERITCTFVNGKRPNLSIYTQFHPHPTDLEWKFVGTGAIGDFFLSNSERQKTFTALDPGEYTITEILPEGYAADVDCDDYNLTTGQGSVTLNLEAGRDVACTFTTRRLAAVTIVKNVGGNPPAVDWQFSGDLGDFTLPAAGGEITFSDVPAGIDLDIIETSVADYLQEDAACFETKSGLEVYGVLGPGRISVAHAGVDLTCYFSSTSLEGTNLVVEKVVLGDVPEEDWRLGYCCVPDVGGVFFTLPAAGGSMTFESLPPRTYELEEAVTDYIQSVSCSDGSTGGKFISFEVALGQTTTCTFTNTQKAIVTIIKQVKGGAPQASWLFSGGDTIGDFELPAKGGSLSFEVPPGSYQISELSMVEDYSSSAACTDGSSGKDSVSLQIEAGETVSCTFTSEYVEPGHEVRLPFITR